ncbi:hypothetical protein GOP47_0030691 [Adiantum capillus-veneris]|nr:hypothetical protein GOP47_0030691 [Adiantum capillus-veneris]
METTSDDDASLLELLQRFLDIQHLRASIYSRLNRSTRIEARTYLKCACFCCHPKRKVLVLVSSQELLG